MSPDFDPYSNWLQIATPTRPLNYYELLGLPHFEGRAQVIDFAYEQQSAKLTAHLNGERSRLAKRTLIELESAKTCLNDAETKERYDQRLRVQLGLPGAGTPQSASVTLAKPSSVSDGELDLAPLDDDDHVRAKKTSPSRLPTSPPALDPVPSPPEPSLDLSPEPQFDSLFDQLLSGESPLSPLEPVAEATPAPRMALSDSLPMKLAAGGIATVVLLGLVMVVLTLFSGDEHVAQAPLEEDQTSTQETPADQQPKPKPQTSARPNPAQPQTPRNKDSAPQSEPMNPAPPATAAPNAPASPAVPSNSGAQPPSDADLSDPEVRRSERERRYKQGLDQVEVVKSRTAREKYRKLVESVVFSKDQASREVTLPLLGRRVIDQLTVLHLDNEMEAIAVREILSRPVSITLGGVTHESDAAAAVEAFLVEFGELLPEGIPLTSKWVWQETQFRLSEAAPVKDTTWLADVPRAVDLPPIQTSQLSSSTSLFRCSDPDELALASKIAGVKEQTVFSLTRDRSAKNPTWNVSMDSDPRKPSVAAFSLEDGRLVFRWLIDAGQIAAEQLRNCMLSVRLGDEQRFTRLRTPIFADAIPSDLSKTIFTGPTVKGLALPAKEAWRLEIMRLDGFPKYVTLHPDKWSIGHRDMAPITLKSTPPMVELRVQMFHSGNVTSVRATPVIVDTDTNNTTIPFTKDRMTGMVIAIPRELEKAQRDLTLNQNNRSRLEAAISRVSSSRSGNLAEENQRQVELDGLQSDLRRCITRLNNLAENIPALQRRLGILPELVKVGSEVHNQAAIHLRVFYVCDGHEVDLLLASPVGQAALEDQFRRLRGRQKGSLPISITTTLSQKATAFLSELAAECGKAKKEGNREALQQSSMLAGQVIVMIEKFLSVEESRKIVGDFEKNLRGRAGRADLGTELWEQVQAWKIHVEERLKEENPAAQALVEQICGLVYFRPDENP